MDSEMRGWLPKHGDRGRRGLESVGRLWRWNEEEICGAAILPRLRRADQDFHDRHGSTRVFCFCVFVGKVAFYFPRQALAFSFFIVCRRLVVFSLFFRRHCKHASGVLRGFF